jgi:hypothetical protein
MFDLESPDIVSRSAIPSSTTETENLLTRQEENPLTHEDIINKEEHAWHIISKDNEQRDFRNNLVDRIENPDQINDIPETKNTLITERSKIWLNPNVSYEDTMPIIWLDIDVHETDANIELQKRLKGTTRLLKVFNVDELCEDHIRQLTVDERVIFIVSGSSSTVIISLVHDLSQIKVIYIYSREIDYYEKKFQGYQKVNITENDNYIQLRRSYA